jgi:hypothetical protein
LKEKKYPAVVSVACCHNPTFSRQGFKKTIRLNFLKTESAKLIADWSGPKRPAERLANRRLRK